VPAVTGRRPSALDPVITLSAADPRARYGRGPRRLIKWLLDPFALVGVYLVLMSAARFPHAHA
jgi:hypothetical protein